MVLAARATGQFGPLTPLIPLGFLATAVRRPRYALLTGIAFAITCFFAASYVNADIGRYFLVPWLFAWTWLAVLGAFVATVVANVATGTRIYWRRHPTPTLPSGRVGRGDRVRRRAGATHAGRCPGPVSGREREPRRSRRRLGRPCPGDHGAQRDHRELVEPLHAAMVCTARRGSTHGREDRRRQDDPRRRTGRHLHGDRGRISGSAPSTSSATTRTRSTRLGRRYELEFVDGGVSARSLTRVLGLQGCRRVTATAAPATDPGTAPRRPGRAPVVLLSGPQRGGQPGRPRRGGPRRPADPRRHVRDHRRQRRLT